MRTIYRLINYGVVLNAAFPTREAAEEYAKKLLSIHPKINWNDVYQIKEELLPEEESR